MGMGNKDHDQDQEKMLGLVGKLLCYRYDNGWRYETYIKNATTVDYRIHSGMVGGRWVKSQTAKISQLAGEERYKIDWTEPTGTSVSLLIDLGERQLHGTIFFPAWVHHEPLKTVCFQNDHLEKMRTYRNAGPIFPIFVVSELAQIKFVKDCGPDMESVISCPPAELSSEYIRRWDDDVFDRKLTQDGSYLELELNHSQLNQSQLA